MTDTVPYQSPRTVWACGDSIHESRITMFTNNGKQGKWWMGGERLSMYTCFSDAGA